MVKFIGLYAGLYADIGIKRKLLEDNVKDRRPPRDFYGVYGLAAAFLLTAAAASAVYYRALDYPFNFDDLSYIQFNDTIKDLGNYWPPLGTRYFSLLSFALNYAVAGLDVRAYRLTNIVIHVANGSLVFILLSMTGRCLGAGYEREKRFYGVVYALALLSALVFVVHPVNTQAVTYIVQRMASLAAFFYLLSIVLYVRSVDAPRGAAVYYVLSIISAVMLQKTKEIGFTLGAVIILYELSFLDFSRHEIKMRLKRVLPFLLCMLIIPATLFLESHFWKGTDFAEELRKMQVEELASLSRFDYLITQFRVIWTYLRLILLPINQKLLYDYPLFHSFFSTEVWLSFVFLSIFFASAVYLYFLSGRKKDLLLRIASFGVFWFFVTLSIESSVIPIKDVIFEHRLYLPSIGIIFAACALYLRLCEAVRMRFLPGFSLKRACILFLVAAILPLAAAAYLRNGVWKDDMTLWIDNAAKSPQSARAQYNLGWVYHVRKDYPRAIELYQNALRIEPEKEDAHYNLAVAYQETGERAKAAAHFRESVRIKPDKEIAWYNLAANLQRLGDGSGAIAAYKEALKLNPANEDAHYNIAYAYDEAGNAYEAVSHYREALRLNAKSADVHFNLGVIYAKTGDRNAALSEFNAALALRPGYSEAVVWLKKLGVRGEDRKK